MKNLTVLFFCLVAVCAKAQITQPNPLLAIGILNDKNQKALKVNIITGRYLLLNDKGDTLQLLAKDDNITISAQGWNVAIKTDSVSKQSKNYTLQAVDSTASFQLETPAIKTFRVYDGSLRIASTNGILKLVNKVYLEEYVDDVLRAEVGKDHPFELYKVQAVVSRTYVLDNLNKHKAEFFNLCDQVHCQVYSGKYKPNDLIDSAVAVTRGEIIIYNNKPITAAFFANCGGQTVNSEDVWNHPLPYLRSVVDSFCTSSPGACWEKTITLNDWKNYFVKKGVPFKQNDTLFFTYNQNNRMLYYLDKQKKVPLKEMRTDLKLRSTYFSVYTNGNNVVLTGRGYGHGVGMCQEGASAMAKRGYDYKTIINYYFKGVEIAPIQTILKN